MSNEWDVELYKIKDCVDKTHDDRPVRNIDFRRDLKPDIALEKTITMRSDGRPELKSYHYQGELLAYIHVYFILDANGLMTRRTESLHYVKTDEAGGGVSPAIIIKDKNYGTSDVKFVIEEKKQSRHLILSEIKATVLVALTWANPTLTPEQVVGLGFVFNQASYDKQIEFEDFGYPTYRDFIAACDPSDPDYAWMDTDIGGGATLQDYMVGALTYTSESNHPEA